MLIRNTKRKPNTYMYVATGLYTTTTGGKKVLAQGDTTADLPAIDSMTTGQLAFANGSPLAAAFNKVINVETPANLNNTPTLSLFYKAQPINKYPFKNIKYFTNDIEGKNPVKVTFSRYVAPTNAVWTLNVTNQTYYSNTRYEVAIDTFGNYIDENFSIQGQAYTGGCTTPDFPSNTVQANVANMVLNQIGKELNLMGPLAFPRAYGYNPVLVLGYKLDNTVGTVPTTSRVLNSALTAGTGATLPIWNSKSGMKSAELSGEQITSLKAAATSLGAGANFSFVAIDTVVGDNLTSPAYLIDGLIFLALDREKSFVDFNPRTKIQIRNVGAAKGFSIANVTAKQVLAGTEGTNTEMLYYMFKNDFRQRLYRQNVTEELRQDEQSIVYPNPVDLTKKYCVLTIQSQGDDLTAMDGLTPVEPFKTVIIAEDTNPAGALSASSPTMNTIKAAVTQWLIDNKQDPIFE